MIEKDVPMPDDGAHWRRYPFHKMEVGDSLLGDKNMANAAYVYGHRVGKKFISRCLDKETGEYRIWRSK